MATASKKMPLISAISLYIVATQKSQSVENNTSTIEYEAYLYNPNYTYYYAWNEATMVVKVDGSTVKTLNNIQYDFRSGSRKQCVASGTTTVNHSSDGTKNLTASVQVTFPSAHPGAGNETVSVSFNLTTIPRKTEVTSVANLTINEAATTLSVGLSRKSASFTHVLALSVNGVNIPDWTTSSHNFTGTQSCSVNLTKAREILSAMPTKVTATLTVTCTTKNASGTVIGSHSASSTCTVNSSVKPSITGASVTASTPAGAISGRSRSYAVKGVSNLSVNYSPSAGYGSTLQSVTVVMNGVSKSENPASFPASASGTNTATITATDKRGRTATATPSISVVDYSPLTAQVTNLDRQSANNGRMTLSVKVTTSQILYGGVTTNGYEIKATAQPVGGGATTTPVNDKVTTGYLTASTQTYNPTTSYPETTAYNVTITIKDDYSSATIQGTLSTASYPLVLGSIGIGVGGVPQPGRALDVYGDSYLNGAITSTDNARFPSVGVGKIPEAGRALDVQGDTYFNGVKVDLPEIQANNSLIDFSSSLTLIDGVTNLRAYKVGRMHFLTFTYQPTKTGFTVSVISDMPSAYSPGIVIAGSVATSATHGDADRGIAAYMASSGSVGITTVTVPVSPLRFTFTWIA